VAQLLSCAIYICRDLTAEKKLARNIYVAPHKNEFSASMSVLLLNDKKLTQLPTVTNPQAMAKKFAANWREVNGLEVTGCAIEKIFYRPEHSCTVLYRLFFRNGERKPLDHWVTGKVFPSNRAGKRYQEAVAANHENNGTASIKQRSRQLEPVSFLSDLDMVVWAFPLDAKIVNLPAVISLEFVQEKINAHLAAFGFSANWRCANVELERVKYMPGKRCVLRYHARFQGPAGDTRDLTFYSKTYQDAKSRYHFEVLNAAYQQLRARNAIVQIPRLIVHLDEANTFWQEEWKGRPLIEVWETYDWNILFPRLAAAVVDLHCSEMQNLRRGPDLDEVLQVAVDDAVELFEMMPQLQPRLQPMLDRLAEVKNDLAKQPRPNVPIHGAMRLEQMLARDHEFAMVDFDALALGDPLADVAELTASLQFLELSQGKSRAPLAAVAELFYQSYAANVPWAGDRRRLAWYALAYWISKMYLACKNLDLAALAKLETAGIEIAEEWRKLI